LIHTLSTLILNSRGGAEKEGQVDHVFPIIERF
jgi:hypothetical protein